MKLTDASASVASVWIRPCLCISKRIAVESDAQKLNFGSLSPFGTMLPRKSPRLEQLVQGLHHRTPSSLHFQFRRESVPLQSEKRSYGPDQHAFTFHYHVFPVSYYLEGTGIVRNTKLSLTSAQVVNIKHRTVNILKGNFHNSKFQQWLYFFDSYTKV